MRMSTFCLLCCHLFVTPVYLLSFIVSFIFISEYKFNNTKSMKKHILLIIGFLILSFISVGQTPEWNVNEPDFQYSMTIIGKLRFKGQFPANENDKLAAFIDGQCRGFVTPQTENPELKGYFFLMVHSNVIDNEKIDFLFYHAKTDSIYALNDTIDYFFNEITGTTTEPYEWIIRNDSADFVDFRFENQIGESIIDYENKTIKIEVPPNTNLTNFSPDFELSYGAKALINGVEQQSGITSCDFTNIVTYEVISEDKSAVNRWEITINVEQTSGFNQNSISDCFKIYPNPFNEILVVSLSNCTENLTHVELNTITGKTIFRKKVQKSRKVIINTSNIPKGIYILKLNTKNNKITYKLIKAN